MGVEDGPLKRVGSVFASIRKKKLLYQKVIFFLSQMLSTATDIVSEKFGWWR